MSQTMNGSRSSFVSQARNRDTYYSKITVRDRNLEHFDFSNQIQGTIRKS